MNFSMIRYILGWVLKLEGLFLLLPCLTALIYKEQQGFVYLAVAAFCVFIGQLMSFCKPKSNVFYLKEGCVATSLSWILMSIFGCLPFVFTGEIPSFTDALFETISGFTTTGASILSDVEAVSHCSTLWRCFTHWIGGMGVLVFLLAIIPMSGGSHINLMKAESPGPSVGKIVPKIKQTARILYLIYILLSILQLVLLLLGGMPFFEALNTTFATAGTGGFGIKNDSFTSYSPYLQWVTAIFMLLFSFNFNVFYLLLLRNFKKAFSNEEVRWFLLIVLVAVSIITANIYEVSGNLFKALTDATFQVASLISSTGFASANFDLWPEICKTTLIIIMFIGACAGSTGGGLKVSRFIIMVKSVIRECYSYIHPKSIRKLQLDGKDVEDETVRAVGVYVLTFLLIYGLSLFCLSFDKHSFTTNFTAVLATFNNIGPGLDAVGPTCNFGFFSDFSKYVLMFDMLAGRLELFPLLILFHHGTWNGIFRKRK
ncbi:MAG: TrkH family potassium uptake protein [Lachnospiraceae bacterium]|nr:TrkH family potassium uptake protein [Lachnospiraceae bacterium]